MSSDRPAPTRATPRQATSAVAFVGEEPGADDPLLAFEPFLHTQPRRNSITPDLQRRFVATLAATGIVKVAAKRIGKSIEALYKLRARPGAEGFAEAWDAAVERGARRLEDLAMERAMLGTRTPIVSGGEILGHWDKPDNALLRFLLAHRLPQTYGVQRVAVGMKGAAPAPSPEPSPAKDPYEESDDFLHRLNLRFEVQRRKMLLLGELTPSEAEQREIDADRDAFFALTRE
ncbi:hypothetical protein [Qipengyuania flava]|uniref:hypothetical protein n=1 Tax=Qipengyuania flava TaxID=192812 RepID=UPI00215ADAA2|nr:hypothetical protein [Qipengyuania flava]